VQDVTHRLPGGRRVADDVVETFPDGVGPGPRDGVTSCCFNELHTYETFESGQH